MAVPKTTSHAPEQYTRFTLAQRIEHIVLLLSFTTLGITGLVQKFSTSPISMAIIDLLGGIETTRIIHRAAAIIFVAQSLYHILVLGYKVFVKRSELTMLPGLRDVTNAIDVLRYNLGLMKEHPKMPRYNFAEKAEYWALVWGGIVMALTGFILWNPIATARFLPGTVIPAAKAAHGAEALLAVLAIIIWHFYSVHIKFFNKSMFTGKLARHHMEQEHGEELEKMLTGTGRPPADPAGVRRRERLYLPVALLTGLVLAVGLYWFATFEETAIATVPSPVTEVPVFVPLTPTPGPTNTVENNEIGSPITHEIEGREECDTCHGPEGIRPYPADHAGRPNESCEVCHKPGPTPTPGGEQPAGGGGAAKPIPHPIEGVTYQDCTTCHGPGQMKPFPENHNSFTSDSCTACHQAATGGTPEAGVPATADETPAAPAGGAKAIPHPIEGEAYEVCTNCHGEGQIKPFPDNHKTFPPESCTTCHQPAEIAATPEAAGTSEATPEGEGGAPAGPRAMPANHDPTADAYKDCLLCHDLGKVRPFPENHAAFPTDSCTSCHPPAEAAAPAATRGVAETATPATAETPAAAATARATPAPTRRVLTGPLAMPANHDPEAAAYTDCVLCHGPDKVRPYPENHVGFPQDSDTCTACHPKAE